MLSSRQFTKWAVTVSALAGAIALWVGPSQETAQAAAVGPSCGLPTSGDCCVDNGTPGCDDLECCLLVCTGDPFCCDVAWDGICAGEACGPGGLCFQAEPISDLLATSAPPAPNQVQFGAPDVPAIPADFFGPGSDPFAGSVPFVGVPFSPGVTEDFDTQVDRGGDPVFPLDPPGSVGTVPIELVALSLRSANPITVTYVGGQFPEEWDMAIGLSRVDAPHGQLTALKTHPNGGTFDADFFVQPVFTFVKVNDPNEVRVIDTGQFGIPPNHLFINGGDWVHNVNPFLEQDLILPKGSQWVPGIFEVVQGDPNSQIPTDFTGLSKGGGVEHTIGQASTKQGRCEVTSKTIPSNQSACTTTTTNGKTNVFVTFGMDAAFRDNVECCEYRQNVKGEFKYNGKKVPHEMNTGVFLDKNVFKEDGFGVPTPAGSNPNYGHRNGANNPGHDRYSNPGVRGAGANYNGTDAPGFRGMTTGRTYSIELSFEGKIIDTCNGTSGAAHTWSVSCNGTALGPFPDPLVEILTPTTINGRAAVLGVYLYPGDLLTVIGSIHNGFGSVPIDASEVDITVSGLVVLDVPDAGALPESDLSSVMAHAIYDFDYPAGSPLDLLVSFTYGLETQIIPVTLPPLCPWDCADLDGTVGIVDFLGLLAQWGGPGSCDFDGGGVGIVDFLTLLGNWGPCP